MSVHAAVKAGSTEVGIAGPDTSFYGTYVCCLCRRCVGNLSVQLCLPAGSAHAGRQQRACLQHAWLAPSSNIGVIDC